MTYEEFCTRFQIQLNEQQTEAVRSVEGPVLLLAVPGSGKTTVLITRLGYMIYCVGIAPQQILTLTYTVAATHDMAARFCSYFGEELGDRPEKPQCPVSVSAESGGWMPDSDRSVVP